MGIQQRLLKARYSEYNLHMPHRDELVDLNLPKHIVYQINTRELVPQFISLLTNPPIKDRYYKVEMKKLVEEYIELGGQGRAAAILNKAIKYIIFFYRNPNLYQNNLSLFSIPFLSFILFDIRQHNMNKLYKLGKLPAIWDKTNPASNGYYKLPKPMTNKCTIALSLKIIDILEPKVVLYKKRLS